jgi:hypothetical protein
MLINPKAVTSRINQIEQPEGGYVKIALFKEIKYDNKPKIVEESCPAIVVDLTVNSLTGLMAGISRLEIFNGPIDGYTRYIIEKAKSKILKKELELFKDNKNTFDSSKLNEKILNYGFEMMEAEEKAGKGINYLLNQIIDLSDESIISTYKAVAFDFLNRYQQFKDYGTIISNDINPDKKTIKNIRIMVNRALDFLKEYGPIKAYGIDFGKAYTDYINIGHVDYLTKDTLWDIKTSKRPISIKSTLQVVVYWIMGQHSRKEEFKNIDKVGIFNPRENKAYILETKDIPAPVIKKIEKEVIGYQI